MYDINLKIWEVPFEKFGELKMYVLSDVDGVDTPSATDVSLFATFRLEVWITDYLNKQSKPY